MQSERFRKRLFGVFEDKPRSKEDVIHQQQEMLSQALKEQWLIIQYFQKTNSQCEIHKAIVKSELMEIVNSESPELQNIYQSYGMTFPIAHRNNIQSLVEEYLKDCKSASYKSLLTTAVITHVAKTSGTSVGEKFVPISPERVEYDKAVMWQIIQRYLSQYPESRMFYGKTLTMGSALNGRVGYISSILARHAGWLVNTFMRLPSQKTAGIKNREEKKQQIAQEVIQGWPVTVMAWVMTRGIEFLKYFRDMLRSEYGDNGDKKFLEYFGKCELFILGWAPVGKMIQAIEAIFKEIQWNNYNHQDRRYISTYNASEGFMGFGKIMTWADASAPSETMKLVTNHGIVYQFIEKEKYHALMDAKKKKEKNGTAVGTAGFATIGLDQVEANKEYVVLLTHPSSGLWNYCIGDILRFTDVKDFLFEIVGRTSASCNVFNEHVEEIHIVTSVDDLKEKMSAHIWRYLARPIVEWDLKNRYEWVIESDDKNLDVSAISSNVHQSLQLVKRDGKNDEKSNYGNMAGKTILDPVIHVVPIWTIEQYEQYWRETTSQTKSLPVIGQSEETIPAILQYAKQNGIVVRSYSPLDMASCAQQELSSGVSS